MFEQGQKGQFIDQVLFHVMEVNRLERMVHGFRHSSFDCHGDF